MRSETGGGTAAIFDGGAESIGLSDEMRAVLRERARLAVELHDVIAQNFQHILLQLDAARGALGPGAGLAGRHVADAEERLQACWDELRGCIHSMTPTALVRGNLVAALARHVAMLSEAAPAAIAFEVCGTPSPLSGDVESQLLPIAQEAVTNALRHSGATRIAIELAFDADALRLTVTDNGEGFDVRRAAEGFGLSGMRERADRIGAELAIESERGLGTEVRVSVPREAAAEHVSSDELSNGVKAMP
ncbi:MAG TPA: sensor histidine kinase [Tepidisphaeraceae bacterium]|jgi:signal transduction histidine kinase